MLRLLGKQKLETVHQKRQQSSDKFLEKMLFFACECFAFMFVTYAQFTAKP